jgi:hypothetical protein
LALPSGISPASVAIKEDFNFLAEGHWHVKCTLVVEADMARTIKIAKYIQVPEPGGLFRPPVRRAPAKPPALYLLQLRARAVTRFAPRRLTIPIHGPANPNARPQQVKITHT